MDAFFVWVELSSFSVWMRESPSVLAFPTILALHTVGLAFLAGPNVAVDLRLLGFAPQLPLQPLGKLFPLMWAGFWLNAVTGTALVIAYPAKALTNPLFYVKLLLIALALVVLRVLRARMAMGSGGADAWSRVSTRSLAAVSIGLWLATILSGRWLAYTYSRLLAYADL